MLFMTSTTRTCNSNSLYGTSIVCVELPTGTAQKTFSPECTFETCIHGWSFEIWLPGQGLSRSQVLTHRSTCHCQCDRRCERHADVADQYVQFTSYELVQY